PWVPASRAPRGAAPRVVRTGRTRQLSLRSLSLLLLREADRPALLPHAARAVELRGLAAARAGACPAAGRDHPAVLGDDAAPEVRAVEMNPPDGLVYGAELREREGIPDERRRDPGALELRAYAGDGVAHDRAVVEREFERPVEDVGRGLESSMRRIGP